MMLAATIAFVDEDLCRGHSGKLGYLRVRGFERVAVIRIAVQRFNADDPTTLGSRDYRHLATELVFLVLFPFRDAFHFRRLHAVKLVFVCSLLLIDAEARSRYCDSCWSSSRPLLAALRCRSRITRPR